MMEWWKKSKWLALLFSRTYLAVLISLLWLGAIWYFVVIPNGGLPIVLAKEPNEVGDFLAGVFAPLACFWFVIAYWLQSEELKLTHNEVAKQVVAISATEQHQRRDTFFRLAEIIFEQMMSVASSLDTSGQSREYKERWLGVYQAGEKYVFFNLLLQKFTDAHARESLLKKIADWKDIQPNIPRFCDLYSLLLKEASKASDNDTLRMIYLDSPVGKLYFNLVTFCPDYLSASQLAEAKENVRGV